MIATASLQRRLLDLLRGRGTAAGLGRCCARLGSYAVPEAHAHRAEAAGQGGGGCSRGREAGRWSGALRVVHGDVSSPCHCCRQCPAPQYEYLKNAQQQRQQQQQQQHASGAAGSGGQPLADPLSQVRHNWPSGWAASDKPLIGCLLWHARFASTAPLQRLMGGVTCAQSAYKLLRACACVQGMRRLHPMRMQALGT